MCGRFAATADPAKLATELDAVDESGGVAGVEGAPPNYNVAPTTQVLTLVERHSERGDTPSHRIRWMRWGFVPHWAKSPGDGPPNFNVRGDSALTKAMYQPAARSRRCLVPMDGWYEWETEVDERTGKTVKTPRYMSARNGSRLLVAGLWSVWHGHSGAAPVLSAAIVTTDSVGALEEVHDRMPLVLPSERWEEWLDPDAALDPALLEPASEHLAESIDIRRVSRLVNNVRNNGPELLAPDAGEPAVGEQISLL